jgi:hypothetical protein
MDGPDNTANISNAMLAKRGFKMIFSKYYNQFQNNGKSTLVKSSFIVLERTKDGVNER